MEGMGIATCICNRKSDNEFNNKIVSADANFNRNLEVYAFVGKELNNGLTHCILKVKKALFKIETVKQRKQRSK